MVDTVTTKVLYAGSHDYVVQLTNQSDGTGESGALKIDKSSITGPNGKEPSKIDIRKIQYNVDGMRVDLFWDHTSDVLIATLGGAVSSGSGEFCYQQYGDLRDTGTGGTGDLILTTSGHTSGDSYNILLHCRLRD